MRDSFNEINITPLTDIFLVLLIIMMVIAPLLDQQGLNLAVPEVVNQEQIAKDSKNYEFLLLLQTTDIYLMIQKLQQQVLSKLWRSILKIILMVC